MPGKGGRVWYQSIGLAFVYNSAHHFKGPRPFKPQKTVLSGLRTPQGACYKKQNGTALYVQIMDRHWWRSV
jgi:hypothetical protein